MQEMNQAFRTQFENLKVNTKKISLTDANIIAWTSKDLATIVTHSSF